MKIKTKAFGEIEISDKQRIYFEDGLLGFDDIKKFVLLDTDEDSPFYWLQSEEVTDIAFLVVDPNTFFVDYKNKFDKKDLADIGVKDESEILVFCILTVHDDFKASTVNLLGPIVINKLKRVARQVISLDDTCSVRHPLFSAE